MSGKTEADRAVINNADAAELAEQIKRDAEKSVMTAQREKEEAIAIMSEAAGKIKAMNFVKWQADFLNLVVLKQIKESKEYRSQYGVSWERFCEQVGVSRRWVDEQLADIKPFKSEFLEAFLRFSGMPLSKIKYLGEAVSGANSGISIDDNAIIYNGETIPLDAEHKDDIQALLETLTENHKKQAEEQAAAIKTKERLLEAKETVINKMEREIARLEKKAPPSDLSPEEQELLDALSEAQLTVMKCLFDCLAKVSKDGAPSSGRLSFYTLLIFLQKIGADMRQDLQELYPEAEQAPWEVIDWELPAEHVMIDNMPFFYGRGVGQRYKDYMDKRNPPKERKEE